MMVVFVKPPFLLFTGAVPQQTCFQLLKMPISSEAFRIIIYLIEESFYKKGICTISISKIAEECFFSKTKRNIELVIPSFIKELENLNLIEVERKKGYPSTYKILDFKFNK
jgi:hypothetical protein